MKMPKKTLCLDWLCRYCERWNALWVYVVCSNLSRVYTGVRCEQCGKDSDNAQVETTNTPVLEFDDGSMIDLTDVAIKGESEDLAYQRDRNQARKDFGHGE